MKKKLFKELVKSVKQAGEIRRSKENSRKPVACKIKPKGCICNPDYWEGWWKICEKYEKSENDFDGRCRVCDHDKGCHKQ